MSELDVMRELTREFSAPSFDQLVAVSRRRRRRAAAAVVAAVAVVALGVGAVAVALPDTSGSPQPTPQPSPPTPTVGTDPSLERIRARGEAQDQVFTPDGALVATKYVVCHGCLGEGPSHIHLAIEVTAGDTSALFGVNGGDARVVLLDDDTVLVQDSPMEEGPGRQRLLRADGTEVELRAVTEPAPAVPGPGVFVDDYLGSMVGMVGMESLAVVDEEARTVQPLDAPADVRYWGPNTHEALWGVTDDCRVFWVVDGAWQEGRPGCRAGSDFTYLVGDWFPAGWLEPGRMVVAEQSTGTRVVLHVTLDGGETWQEYPVREDRFVTATLRDIG